MNTFSTKFFVDGKPLYDPSECAEEEDSLADENSGRNDAGVMEIFFIRTSIKKWSLKYAVMTAEEYRYTRDLLQAKTFSFTAPRAGEQIVVNAYCSKNSGDACFYRSASDSLYKNMQFNIIER